MKLTNNYNATWILHMMRCLAGRLFRLRLVMVFLFVAALAILGIMWKLPYYDISHLNDFRTFRHHWCRMHEWRVDWEGMVKPCENRVAWTRREINSELRSDARRSFITKWEILPAGQFSRFFIQSVTKNGHIKSFGGDAWRVYIKQGPASIAPQVWDLDNGMYEVVFLAMEPGNYSAQITLDFTLCDGLRDPPVDWFIIGTVQGKYQPDGVLGFIGDDYILQPLGGQKTFSFFVPWSSALTPDAFVTPSCIVGLETEDSSKNLAKSCGIKCNFVQNGFGRWVNREWLPYVTDIETATGKGNSVTQADTLWIYGDSVSQRFLNSLKSRGICQENFKKCISSYMWIYELTSEKEAKTKFEPNDFDETIILQHMSEILNSSDLKTQDSVFLFNLGVHYSVSLNFTTYRRLIDNVVKLVKKKLDNTMENMPILIWKTTTSIEKEMVHKMYAELPRNKTHWRFHTHQRLELFHKYAVSRMCKAGIPVLDVYSMTASYPNGTLDHVHYNEEAQRAAEDQLIAFVSQEIKKKRRRNPEGFGLKI